MAVDWVEGRWGSFEFRGSLGVFRNCFQEVCECLTVDGLGVRRVHYEIGWEVVGEEAGHGPVVGGVGDGARRAACRSS